MDQTFNNPIFKIYTAKLKEFNRWDTLLENHISCKELWYFDYLI